MIVRVAFFILMSLGLIGFGTVAWITTRPMGIGGAAAHEDDPGRGAANSRWQPAHVGRRAAKGNSARGDGERIQHRHRRIIAAASWAPW